MNNIRQVQALNKRELENAVYVSSILLRLDEQLLT